MKTNSGSARPNVVLIVLDAVRRDHMSCYGYDRRTTPSIEGVAEQGIRFQNAYAASCWTIPSHASLFTGLYPSEHRADLDSRRLAPQHRTLAERLAEVGYRTGCITCNGFISDHTGLDRGFQHSVDAAGLAGGTRGFLPRLVRGLHRRWRDRTGRDRGARRATRLARRWLSEQEKGTPFFLFMNLMDCHLPYRLRGEARYRFLASPADRRRANAVPQEPFAVMAGRETLSQQELEDLRALYDGALSYLDEQIRSIDAALSRGGLDDRTLFIITSDHGESFGEHGLMDHQYGLYEHLIRVPMIARLPARESSGTDHDRLVQHSDWVATICEWVGADGTGLDSSHAIFSSEPRGEAVAEYLVPNLGAIQRRFPGADVSHLDLALRAIRRGPYKLTLSSKDDTTLIDLRTDPEEARDIRAERPDVVRDLRARLQARVGDWPGREPEPDADPFAEVRDRLEALGYL